MNDDAFWEAQVQDPKDAYHFAFPCHHMTVAHTTPKVRSLENPYGDEADPETSYYNGMAYKMARLLHRLLGRALVLVEQPLFTYLYLFREMLGIIGMPGVVLFRADDCMVGTP